MSTAMNSDVRERLILARVGWCTAYNGDDNDPPRDGGAYNRRFLGSEHRNFVSYRGHYYGYARSNGYLNLNRVMPRTLRASETGHVFPNQHVEDVCVAMIAKSYEYGQVLVGWYRHATLFMGEQKHQKRGFYHWKCLAGNAVLLPVNDRTLVIPKGKSALGQANYGYSRDLNGKLIRDRSYLDAIRKVILSSHTLSRVTGFISNEEAVVRGQGFQADVRYRKEIEDHAMRLARRDLCKQYLAVKDVSKERNYDYHCTSADGTDQKVEVKGTTTEGEAVLVSRSELELAKNEPVDLYIVRHIEIVNGVATGGEIRRYRNWYSYAMSTKATGYQVKLALA